MLIHKDYQGSHFDYLGHSSVNENGTFNDWVSLLFTFMYVY